MSEFGRAKCREKTLKLAFPVIWLFSGLFLIKNLDLKKPRKRDECEIIFLYLDDCDRSFDTVGNAQPMF